MEMDSWLPLDVVNRHWISARRTMRMWGDRMIQADEPALVSPSKAGGELERFRDQAHALTCWDNKQMQWWYFTGHLHTETGRRFAYELVFFDRSTEFDYLGPVPFRALMNKLRVAHFAISDIDAPVDDKRFRYFQKGGVLNPAESYFSSDSFHIDFAGWSAHQSQDGSIRIHASDSGCNLSLELKPGKPLVYHGEGGLSQRAEDSEISSFYCSYTRLLSSGRIMLDGVSHAVQGTSWMDHEKMSTRPELFIHGWNWYSLYLDSGEELMLYQLRDAQGQEESFSFGSWIDAQGKLTHLRAEDIKIVRTGIWASPRSGGDYPIHSRIRVESLGLVLDVRACLPDCEIEAQKSTFVTYWEGPVEVVGKRNGQIITGLGFKELVGYDRRRRTKHLQQLVIPEPTASPSA